MKQAKRKFAMKIAVIGTGNVGGALAQGWAKAGHSVVLGVRNAADPKVVALVRETKAEVKTPADAVAGADVVVLALPLAPQKARSRLSAAWQARLSLTA